MRNPPPSGSSKTQPAADVSVLGDLVRRSPLELAVVWSALVVVAVAGRAWQPAWHVTPLAAVALAAGAVMPGRLLAASVPLAALALGNLFSPPYGSWAMAVVVYVAAACPVLWGRLLGARGSGLWHGGWRAVVCGSLASSLVFFFSTNLAYWLLTDEYPRTASGLLACFVAALPFYRWMPVGDLAWSLAVFAAMAVAGRSIDARLGWRSRRLECVVQPKVPPRLD